MTQEETTLVLIRHGESAAQTGGFVSGHDTCRGLSPLGRRQAEALRDRLAATKELGTVDVVYTSILPRAIETAALIAPALATPRDAIAECDWCEIHPGEAEGLTWDEIAERYPAGDAFVATNDPFISRFPGGETWAEFAARAGGRLRRVALEHPGERVVVVSHGGIIGASFVALGELPIGQVIPMTYEVTNSSITEWRCTGNTWRLARFNDAAHLARLA
jgi:broad specificity phosphatase PhoE